MLRRISVKKHQGRAQKFEKGGAQFPDSVSTEIIGEDQKNVFTSSDVQFSPQNQVKNKQKVIASLDVLFPLFRWLEIYISLIICQRGGHSENDVIIQTLGASAGGKAANYFLSHIIS